MTSGTYGIIGPTGAYIGHSSNIERRWEHHLWYLVRNKHHAPHLQHVWNKHGPDAFKWKILFQTADTKLMVQSEQRWIDWYLENSCLYNGRKFAAYPTVPPGYKHTDQSKINMGNAVRGRKHSLETRKKMSEAAKGRIISQEQRGKISQTLTGKKIPKRKTPESFTLEHRKKLGEASRNAAIKRRLLRDKTEI